MVNVAVNINWARSGIARKATALESLGFPPGFGGRRDAGAVRWTTMLSRPLDDDAQQGRDHETGHGQHRLQDGPGLQRVALGDAEVLRHHPESAVVDVRGE